MFDVDSWLRRQTSGAILEGRDRCSHVGEPRAGARCDARAEAPTGRSQSRSAISEFLNSWVALGELCAQQSDKPRLAQVGCSSCVVLMSWNRARWRRGESPHALIRADRAKPAVPFEGISPHRLRAEQHGQCRIHTVGLRADSVQVPFPRPAHHDHVANVGYGRRLRDASACQQRLGPRWYTGSADDLQSPEPRL